MTARQAVELAAALACAAATTCVAIVAVLTPANEPTEWEGDQ